jgi:phosphotransferase system enzyme I (PtsP)
MAAQGIGPVKQMLRSMDSGAVTNYVQTLIERDAPNPRRALSAFARDHGITIT